MAAQRLEVDGRRPAVARLAALPRSYRLTDAEWRVLMVMACDSYDGETTAPGLDNIAAWTGLLRSSVARALDRLCERTEHRPALVGRVYASKGRMRTEWELLLPRSEEDAEQLASVGHGVTNGVTPTVSELSPNRPVRPDAP